MGPDGPMLWGLVDTGWYGVDLVRAKDASFHGLPAIRIDETEQAPGLARSAEFLGWWTRRYAAILSTSWRTPLAAGRNFLLASMESVASAPPGLSIHEWHRRKWQHIRLGPDCLDDLLAQRDHFELSWDTPYVGLLLARELSAASDGRVKSWRKRAREGRLPPLVVWWCQGLYSHVLLDGHDRLHAALLEALAPDIVVLADVTAHQADDIVERRRESVANAALLEAIPSVENRASATNEVLRTAWDPRLEWDYLVSLAFRNPSLHDRRVSRRLLLAAFSCGCVPQNVPTAEDNPIALTDSTGARFDWACDSSGCFLGVQPTTPAPAACPAEQRGGYTFTAARFAVVESACEGEGKVTSFGNWMRPVSCTIDTDCPQLYQFNEPLWFECRRNLCQATTAPDTELVSETEAFLLCYGPYPRSETLTPLSPGGMEVSARVSAACPTAGQPCRVPPQCLAP